MSKMDYRVFYDNYMDTNAATEVTGLIASGASSQEEWDAYREVFNFEPVPNRGSCHPLSLRQKPESSE